MQLALEAVDKCASKLTIGTQFLWIKNIFAAMAMSPEVFLSIKDINPLQTLMIRWTKIYCRYVKCPGIKSSKKTLHR